MAKRQTKKKRPVMLLIGDTDEGDWNRLIV